MEMDKKHVSKLHKGLNKMVARQDSKPSLAYIKIEPVIMTWDEEEGEYIELTKCVRNNKWNGMNLKKVRNRLQPTMPGWFNSHRTVSKEGKYKLSIRGKQYLNKKKKRLLD